MPFASVEEYTAHLPACALPRTQEFIRFMQDTFPRLVPRISFAMPMWWVGDRMREGYVAVSNAKQFFSIHFGDEDFIKAMQPLLPQCTFRRRCVHIAYDDAKTFEAVKGFVCRYLNPLLPTE